MVQQQLMEEALAAGASRFIVKPFTSSRMLEGLQDAGE